MKIDPIKAKERVYKTLSELHPDMKKKEISEIVERIIRDPDFTVKYRKFINFMCRRLKSQNKV